MADILLSVASSLWIVIGCMTLVGLRRWNKRFSELHAELKRQIEEDY